MRPIAFRAAGTDDNPAGASPFCAIPRPTGVQDGDFLVATVQVPGGTGTTITPPDGWDMASPGRVDLSTSLGMAVYTRFALNEPVRWVFALSASVQTTGAVAVYVNVDTFGAVDAAAALATSAAGAHDVPGVSSSQPHGVLVLALAGQLSGTWTAPTGYLQRAAKVQVNGATAILDRSLIDAGAIAATTAGFSVVTGGAAHLLVLRPSVASLSLAEVLERLVGALPGGVEDVYDLGPGGDYYKYFAVNALLLKQQGFDLHDLLRRERDPATAVLTLPDWERALGLTELRVARYGTVPQRQAAAVSKLREAGASSRNEIRAVVAPLLGYSDPAQLEIVETSRSGLDAVNRSTLPAGAIPAAGDYLQTITVGDVAKVSAAGARLKLVLTIADLALITVVLTAPDARQKIWAAGSLGTGAAVGSTRILYAPSMAGAQVGGDWTIQLANAGLAGTLDASSYLYVEGIGRSGATEGHGRGIYEWSVRVDPALVGGNGVAPDYEAVRAAIARIKPAHTDAYLTFKSLNGDAAGVWGDPTNSFWDSFVWE